MTEDTFTPGPTPNTVRAADGKVLTAPDGWVHLPPGDAALTRRVKAGGEHWVGDPTVPKNERGLSWIVRKDAAGEALLKRMDVALQSMMKDCSFTKIRQKYLQTPVLKAEEPCLGKTS